MNAKKNVVIHVQDIEAFVGRILDIDGSEYIYLVSTAIDYTPQQYLL